MFVMYIGGKGKDGMIRQELKARKSSLEAEPSFPSSKRPPSPRTITTTSPGTTTTKTTTTTTTTTTKSSSSSSMEAKKGRGGRDFISISGMVVLFLLSALLTTRMRQHNHVFYQLEMSSALGTTAATTPTPTETATATATATTHNITTKYINTNTNTNNTASTNNTANTTIKPEYPLVEKQTEVKQQQQQQQQQQQKDTPSSIPPRQWNKTNATINVCLFMMDDRIKLAEWIAYHWTVLPIGKLMIGIDPKSKKVRQVRRLLKRWREDPGASPSDGNNNTYSPQLDYTLVDNNTYIIWRNPYAGWGLGNKENIYEFLQKAPEADIQQRRHKRNERGFYLYCLRKMMHEAKRERKRTNGTVPVSRVWLGDTDEYVIPNYIGPHENPNRYDGYTGMPNQTERIAIIQQERANNLPIRQQLPRFSQRITIADILRQTQYDHPNPAFPNCIRFPDLKFTGYETRESPLDSKLSSKTITKTNSLDGDAWNYQHLTTLRHRLYAANKDGSFSKAIMNLVSLDSIPDRFFDTVHKPVRTLCSHWISGVDYMSSIIRFNHYKSGTLESLLERGQSDFRFRDPIQFFRERNEQLGEIGGEDRDIVGWVEWFVEKVGSMDQAKRLLFDPLNESYSGLDTSNYTGFLNTLYYDANAKSFAS